MVHGAAPHCVFRALRLPPRALGRPEPKVHPPCQVEALVREYWRGRSARQAVGSNDKGLGRSIGHLALTRWDAGRPASPGNLVLLTQEEADAHDALALQSLRAREPAFCVRVEAVLGRVRAQFGC